MNKFRDLVENSEISYYDGALGEKIPVNDSYVKGASRAKVYIVAKVMQGQAEGGNCYHEVDIYINGKKFTSENLTGWGENDFYDSKGNKIEVGLGSRDVVVDGVSLSDLDDNLWRVYCDYITKDPKVYDEWVGLDDGWEFNKDGSIEKKYYDEEEDDE